MHVSHPTRSGAKAITYRLVNLLVSFIIFSALLGIEIGGALAVLDGVVSTVLYFIHERVWTRIQWGKYVQ